MKFRAWDEYEKIMRYSKDNGMAYLDKSGEEYTFYFWFDERTGDIVAISETLPFPVTDDPFTMYDTIKHYHKVMMSTGLTDKNGVEIWEGDILNVLDYGLFTVEWIQNTASFGMTQNGRYMQSFFSSERIGYKVGGCVVVGNIFENPELLEDKG